MNRRHVLIAGLWFASGPLPGCRDGSSPGPAASARSRTVAASFYPTTYFADRIGGDAVEVRCPCPPEADPISWMPDRAALTEYQNAAIVVLNGAGYEAWASTASLPTSRVVDCSAPFTGEFLTFPGVTHSHGSGGRHTHAGTDGHTWMDPVNAAVQAEAIRGALSRAWPEHAADFSSRAESLRADLKALASRFEGLTPSARDARLFASHPAYQYIARRYGWSITNIDLPPDAAPSEAQWSTFGHARSEAPGAGRVVMLFEQEPRPETRRRLLEEHGTAAVVFDPCERPGAGTYIGRMTANLERLDAALRAPSR